MMFLQDMKEQMYITEMRHSMREPETIQSTVEMVMIPISLAEVME